MQTLIYWLVIPVVLIPNAKYIPDDKGQPHGLSVYAKNAHLLFLRTFGHAYKGQTLCRETRGPQQQSPYLPDIHAGFPRPVTRYSSFPLFCPPSRPLLSKLHTSKYISHLHDPTLRRSLPRPTTRQNIDRLFRRPGRFSAIHRTRTRRTLVRHVNLTVHAEQQPLKREIVIGSEYYFGECVEVTIL